MRLLLDIEPVSRARLLTACSEMVMQAITQTTDSLHSAAPIGTIFIPCLDGRSHCPEEAINEQQLAAGAQVLQQTLLNLDQQLLA